MSSNILLVPLALSSHPGTPDMHKLDHLTLSHSFWNAPLCFVVVVLVFILVSCFSLVDFY